MKGIDMNKKIEYIHSSYRYFEKGEYHVSRTFDQDVLVLVYEGELLFAENGCEYKVGAGEYFIQQRNLPQTAPSPSVSPKYLFCHFIGEWSGEEGALKKQGIFDMAKLKPLMDKLDFMSHNNATLIEQTALFYEILSKLYQKTEVKTTADEIADFIKENFASQITLNEICEKFHFSKNHIINIFKKVFNMTPFEYIIFQRIKNAERLLEVTSRSAESISYECGFSDYSHFYKYFKKIHGISPKVWRDKKRLYHK